MMYDVCRDYIEAIAEPVVPPGKPKTFKTLVESRIPSGMAKLRDDCVHDEIALTEREALHECFPDQLKRP